jgi:hypothetical protein
MGDTANRLTLRDLPLAARLLIAAFLCAMGVGYVFGLVQVHFQDAGHGKVLPDGKDAVDKYHGHGAMSQFERLLIDDETRPFNGTGSMRAAFFKKSAGWKGAVRKEQKKLQEEKPDAKVSLVEAEASLRKKREAEIDALLVWLHDGAKEAVYKDDGGVPFKEEWADRIDEKFVEERDNKKYVKVNTLIQERCARCHAESLGGGAGQAPLENYEQVAAYLEPERGSGMSLPKLAQTSHVHLFGFGMLYGLTGLAFALTSWPGFLRCILAPLPLVAQVLEITLGWWGGRASPDLAMLTMPLAGVVAAGLVAQILLTLWSLFGWSGRFIVVLLLAGAGVGSWQIKERVVDPYLTQEHGTSLVAKK